MTQRAEIGDWVRIHLVLLDPGERATNLPLDTAAGPYEAWINGWALESALVGEDLIIRTQAGREIRGRLWEAWPAYDHTFGKPHPAMLVIGQSLRHLLAGKAT